MGDAQVQFPQHRKGKKYRKPNEKQQDKLRLQSGTSGTLLLFYAQDLRLAGSATATQGERENNPSAGMSAPAQG